MRKIAITLFVFIAALGVYAQNVSIPQNGRVQGRIFEMGTANSKNMPTKVEADAEVITEQPAGNLKRYTRLGGANRLNSSNTGIEYMAQSGYANIVFATDGSLDVYLKDPICWYNTGAWVKGKLSADKKTITIPTGQPLSKNSQGMFVCMELADISGNKIVYNAANTVVTYKIEDNVIRLQNADGEKHVLAAMWSDDHVWQGYADWSTSYIDENYNPEEPEDPTLPTVLEPKDIETTTYSYMGFDLTFGDDGKVSARELFQTDAIVGMKNGKVYIQGLSPYIREAWVEGTIDGTTMTIRSGQYLGVYKYGGKDYPFYLVGCDSETEAVRDLVFDYNAEEGSMELQEGIWMVENSNSSEITGTVYGVYSGIYLLNVSDGISAVERKVTENSRYYTIDGRGINGVPTRKGLYIVGGKKIVIK